MPETLQLEEGVELTHLHDAPKLLIEWPSRWNEFRTSIRPALSRSTARLAGETPFGLAPYRNVLAAWVLEAFCLFLLIVVPAKIAELRPYVAPRLTSHDVIYYSGEELPRTEDLGGSQSGKSGTAGGNEAAHQTQTIRVARGASLVSKVVDAPNLKLPASSQAVANLLAINPNVGPPPSEGLRSSRSTPNLATTVIAPAPNVTRDYTRGGLTYEAVVPPAPAVARDTPITAPSLNTSVIAPAPDVARDHTLVAPKLDSSIIAPAPNVARDHTRSAPNMSASVVAPAPQNISPDYSRSPVQMANAAVVPPPVSAPERDSVRDPKLSLPAPSVIAPPPSADVSRDMRRLASGNTPEPARTVVPPPPTQSGGGSFVSSLIGKIFGPSEVVPPPPSVTANASKSAGSSLSANVIPPPPTAPNAGTSNTPRGARSGAGSSLGQDVVPPPPSSVAAVGRSGSSSGSLVSSVIPPPPTASRTDGMGSPSTRTGAPGGTLLAENIVPPPPSVGGGSSPSGSGLGSRGSGLAGALNNGSALAPPASGGSGSGSAVVASTQPGSKIGNPGGSAGSLAMSPSGADQPGLGGNGGGSSIGRGNGPGSGLDGSGTGAGKTGAGHGSDPSAHAGISPTSGPGGAGNGASGTPPVPGVSVNGGSTIVTLPSFGSDAGSGSSGIPGRSSVKEQQGPAVTIVATSRSGGAFNFYGKLPGDNYTVYIDTIVGTVVMQFADPTSAAHPYAGSVTGPQGLHTDLPAGLPHARMVVQCVLDASGNIKDARVLEPGPATMTAKVMVAVKSWKFRPAMRGNQPIEVNAMLGFGIDTNDRF